MVLSQLIRSLEHQFNKQSLLQIPAQNMMLNLIVGLQVIGVLIIIDQHRHNIMKYILTT